MCEGVKHTAPSPVAEMMGVEPGRVWGLWGSGEGNLFSWCEIQGVENLEDFVEGAICTGSRKLSRISRDGEGGEGEGSV